MGSKLNGSSRPRLLHNHTLSLCSRPIRFFVAISHREISVPKILAMPRNKSLTRKQKVSLNAPVHPSTPRPRTCPQNFMRPDLSGATPQPRALDIPTPQRDFVGDLADVLDDETRRAGVASAFIMMLDGPPESEWHGADGTISTIIRELHLPLGSRGMVEKVLQEVMLCHRNGDVYSPLRKPGAGGQNKLILLGTMEAQIVADGIEGGLGLTQTTRQVNDHRKQCDPPLFWYFLHTKSPDFNASQLLTIDTWEAQTWCASSFHMYLEAHQV